MKKMMMMGMMGESFSHGIIGGLFFVLGFLCFVYSEILTEQGSEVRRSEAKRVV